MASRCLTAARPYRLIAVFASALLGCNLFVDTTGLYGGSPVPADSADAGDSQPSDAGPLSDVKIADGSVGYCANGHARDAAFCDDFDERPVGFDWEPPVLTPGATRMLDTASVASAPNALSFAIPATDPTAKPTAYQEKIFGDLSGIVCAYDVEVMTAKSGTTAALGMVGGRGGDGQVRVFLTMPSSLDSAKLVQVIQPTSGAPTTKEIALSRWPAKGKFSRVGIRLTLDGAFSVATAFIDDVESGSATIGIYLTRSYAACGIGIPFVAGAAGGWTVRFDNVVITTGPT